MFKDTFGGSVRNPNPMYDDASHPPAVANTTMTPMTPPAERMDGSKGRGSPTPMASPMQVFSPSDSHFYQNQASINANSSTT